MKNKRRSILKAAAVTSFGMFAGKTFGAAVIDYNKNPLFNNMQTSLPNTTESLIGLYGPWASSLYNDKLPNLSFRNSQWKQADLKTWHQKAYDRTRELIAAPSLQLTAQPTLHRKYIYDNLHIEELSWQLPYGRPTTALLLKPAKAAGKLPGILAFHDHGGNKYFGTRKITKTSNNQHAAMKAHQELYYEGTAWANEIAKRGYVVLVSDAFPFASRRVMLQDVPPHLRNGLTDNNPEENNNIDAYNKWAGEHEHVMSKSLFSAGITWPGVFFAEDRIALDILAGRSDVDASNLGCAGLSGGGMRTAFMGGLDTRIKCAVSVGFMTTWRDFVLNKSFTHTWMTYVPLLPQHLDFPEILGLRVPLATMVLNDIDDDLYSLPEMKEADNILKTVYQKAGAEDRYKCSFYPGPHKFDKAMQQEAFSWFDRWLKK